jgi:hypothetical protein
VDPAALLCPEVIDTLQPVGEGLFARVFRSGSRAVKIAHATPEANRMLADEAQRLKDLAGRLGPLKIPRFFLHSPEKAAMVRAFVRHPPVLDLFQRRPPEQWDPLLAALDSALEQVQMGHERFGIQLDITPANLHWDEKTQSLWLVDLGERRAPNPLLASGKPRDRVQAYLRFREKLESSGRVFPMDFPPSGFLHEEIPVGRVPGARLLWHNRDLLRRLGLSWSKAHIMGLANWATHAEPTRKSLPATRYQDSPGLGKNDAKGDGRAVYLGRVQTPRGGRQEIMLKGAGPTPFAWIGNPHHEDGFVTFNRSLWELAICDELARVGVEAPENLALLSTGKTTQDNFLTPSPAAAAMRISATHYRLGHLHRFKKEPEKLIALAKAAGRALIRPDFDPLRSSHFSAWVRLFSENLGRDVGLTDALNIHCFNPTLGNARLDGHLMDFSTVRFFRHCLPHFRYMEKRRTIREHRVGLRRYVTGLVESFRAAGLFSPAKANALKSRGLKFFERRYADGYLEGLGRFLGVDLHAPRRGFGPVRRRRLVDSATNLRHVRAREMVDLHFWKQRVPGPLFDLEGRAPEFMEALGRGERECWRHLRSSFFGQVTEFSAMVAREFVDDLKVALRGVGQKATPRRHHQVIRPGFEAEKLGPLCYHRSTPNDFAEWKTAMECSAGLPWGRWTASKALDEATLRGHRRLPLIHGKKSAVVAGLLPVFSEALRGLLDEHFSGHLVGAAISGPRVLPTHERPSHVLVEGGAADPQTSPLVLHLVFRGAASGPPPREPMGPFLNRYRRLYAPFPTGPTLNDAGIRLHRTLATDMAAWGREMLRQGAPFGILSTVLFFDSRRGIAVTEESPLGD